MQHSNDSKMFIKSTYDNKMQQTRTARSQRGDTQSMKPSTMQRKWVIGSSHYGENINYQRDFQFFSLDDIPSQKKVAHDKMSDFIDPDLLGLKRTDWNSSSKIPKYPHLEETFERKLMKIKIGLLDHPIQRFKPNKIYPGTETRSDYTGWNVSTEQSLLERRRQLEEETKKSMAATAKKQSIVKNYIAPTQYTTDYNNQLRETKKLDEELRQNIRDKYFLIHLSDSEAKRYKYSNPNSSQERMDGAVFRLTHEYKVKHAKPQSDNEAMNLTFKPDLSATLKRPSDYNTYSRTFQVVKSISQTGEGNTATYNPVIERTTENYMISTKKNKVVDEMWQITPEEEERVERYKALVKESARQEEDLPSPGMD